MAFIIQHKCPNCGSNLNLDEVTNSYNCSYCGNSFDGKLINLDDVYAKTFDDFKKKKYKLSDEGYSYLVSKEPYNAIYWRGKILSFLKLSDEKKIFNTEFKHSAYYLSQLIKKIPPDNKSYFDKLIEGVHLKENQDFLNKQIDGFKDSIDRNYREISRVRKTEVNNLMPALVILVSLSLMGVFEYFCYGLETAFYYYIIWGVVFIIPVIVALNIAMSRKKYIKNEVIRIESIIVKVRSELTEYNNRLSELENRKKEFTKELDRLRSKLFEEYDFDPNVIPEVNLKMDKANVIEEHNSYEAINTCPNCSTELSFDSEKKVYFCNSCGATFDYNYMIDFLWIDRAYSVLDKGYYDDAKAEFLKILELRPGDAVALNGLVLATMNVKILTHHNTKNTDEAYSYINKYLPEIPEENKPYFEKIREYERLKHAVKKKNILIDDESKRAKNAVDQIRELNKKKLIVDEDRIKEIERVSRESDLLSRRADIAAVNKKYDDLKLTYTNLISAKELERKKKEQDVAIAKQEHRKCAKTASDFYNEMLLSKPKYDKFSF